MNELIRTIGLTTLGLACLVGAEKSCFDAMSITAFLYLIGGTFTIIGGLGIAKKIMGDE